MIQISRIHGLGRFIPVGHGVYGLCCTNQSFQTISRLKRRIKWCGGSIDPKLVPLIFIICGLCDWVIDGNSGYSTIYIFSHDNSH